MKKSHLIGVLCTSVFGLFTMSSQAAPGDPSGGECDGIDPSSGLFSLCIQAHSAKNRVDLLRSVGASENAIGKARAEVEDAEAMFSELGGGVIPGLYDIGDTGPAGGIVFYLDGNGGGLEAAPADQGTAAWGCNGIDIAGADGTAVGTGAQNTADIIAADCATTGIAADLADTYMLNGYTDWFLPSLDTLNLLYQQADVVGGFTGGNYWSSSETGRYTAWARWFAPCCLDKFDKDDDWRIVRAVRAF